MEPHPERRVCLVGMPGAGKSAVGRRAAALLDVPFFDLDAAVEAYLGMSIADCFARMGEGHFRGVEGEKGAELLSQRGGYVLATGGGAVLDPGTRRLMRTAALTVWLRARVETLSERTSRNRNRPLLAGAASEDSRRALLERLACERGHLYAEVAQVTLDTDGRGTDELARHVWAAVCGAPAGSRSDQSGGAARGAQRGSRRG